MVLSEPSADFATSLLTWAVVAALVLGLMVMVKKSYGKR
jgi:hypothetical protein